MNTLDKPQYPHPVDMMESGDDYWEFLIHLDGVDIYCDAEDRVIPYVLRDARKREYIEVNNLHAGRTELELPPTIVPYLQAHYAFHFL